MSAEGLPPLDVSELRGLMAALHELFTEAVEAGFTELQAIRLIVDLVTARSGGDES